MRVVLGVSGASGSIYAYRLVEELSRHASVETIYTRAALKVADTELEGGAKALLSQLERFSDAVYSEDDFDSPLASSSNLRDAMVIAPCSVKTLSAIVHGYASNLLVRAALTMLRFRRPLVLVVRETPLGVVELGNMLRAAEMGAVVMPAAPGFYHKPRSLDDLVNFVVGKVLDVLGLPHSLYQRWAS